MSQKLFTDYGFGQNSEFEIIQYKPEAIAAAMEQLGHQYAEANKVYEQAKDHAERILALRCVNIKNDKGCSATAARSEAEIDPLYQSALADKRSADEARIKAQSSFKAAEAYSRMILTKVSSEAKLGEFYKKGNLT